MLATGAKQGVFSQTPIPVSAVYEIISPRDPASGLPTGKRQHKPIAITTEWKPACLLFLNALVNNETLTSVLTACSATGTRSPTIKLTNASVPAMSSTGGVTIEFTYQKIEWTWVDGGISASDDWEAPVS